MTPVTPSDPPRLRKQYPHVDGVEDWRAQQTLRLLWDRVFDLEARLQAAEATSEELVTAVNEAEEVSELPDLDTPPPPPVVPGPVPAAGLIVRETPAGAIDGSNATFTLANTPVVGSEQVFLNGLLQDTHGIDYSISGAAVVFLVPPVPGDRVLVTYQKA